MPFFVNYLKYYCLYLDTIEFARDIIRDILPLKHLNKICNTLGITCSVPYVDETGKQHNHQQYVIWLKCTPLRYI
jgi:hypothetical protein